jgi:hypothetical protein
VKEERRSADYLGMTEITAILDRRNDLSTFLVHLTRATGDRSALENLVSICAARTLEARTPVGWMRSIDDPEDVERQTQRAVCFTETPLEHVHALAGRITLWGRERSFPLEPYGVAISKMAARRIGVNPVWYVDMTPGRDWTLYAALNALAVEAQESSAFHEHPAARIFPFVEKMGRWDNNGRIREFSWEREWRHCGPLRLPSSGIIWLCPSSDIAELRARVGERASYPWIDPTWGLERIIAHLAGFKAEDVSPFANPPERVGDLFG